MAYGRWDLPGSGIESVSPALAGGFFSTWPSGKARVLTLKSRRQGTSLVAQWLRLRAPTTEGLGSIPGQGTRSHMPRLKRLACCNQDLVQPNKEILKKKKQKAYKLGTQSQSHHRSCITSSKLALTSARSPVNGSNDTCPICTGALEGSQTPKCQEGAAPLPLCWVATAVSSLACLSSQHQELPRPRTSASGG